MHQRIPRWTRTKAGGLGGAVGKKVMAGSEKRQRQKIHKARFTDEESALIVEQADRAGVSVASLIRFAVLDIPPLRAARGPTVNHEAAAQLLGKLGQCATALRQAAEADNQAINAALIDAAHRDLAEMRVALFQALGREP
jgi:hypothetical protein